jgi:hypothetical protein
MPRFLLALLLLSLSFACARGDDDAAVPPRSKQVVEAARAKGAAILDLRKRIQNSTSPKEKKFLLTILEKEFSHVSLQKFDTDIARGGSSVLGGRYPRPVVFLHIPRTGGRHFLQLLQSELGIVNPPMVHPELLRAALRDRDFSFLDQPWFYVHFDSSVVPSFLHMLRVHDKLPRIVTFLRDPIERLVSE